MTRMKLEPSSSIWSFVLIPQPSITHEQLIRLCSYVLIDGTTVCAKKRWKKAQDARMHLVKRIFARRRRIVNRTKAIDYFVGRHFVCRCTPSLYLRPFHVEYFNIFVERHATPRKSDGVILMPLLCLCVVVFSVFSTAVHSEITRDVVARRCWSPSKIKTESRQNQFRIYVLFTLSVIYFLITTLCVGNINPVWCGHQNSTGGYIVIFLSRFDILYFVLVVLIIPGYSIILTWYDTCNSK